jgi:hypothetical protein
VGEASITITGITIANSVIVATIAVIDSIIVIITTVASLGIIIAITIISVMVVIVVFVPGVVVVVTALAVATISDMSGRKDTSTTSNDGIGPPAAVGAPDGHGRYPAPILRIDVLHRCFEILRELIAFAAAVIDTAGIVAWPALPLLLRPVVPAPAANGVPAPRAQLAPPMRAGRVRRARLARHQLAGRAKVGPIVRRVAHFAR